MTEVLAILLISPIGHTHYVNVPGTINFLVIGTHQPFSSSNVTEKPLPSLVFPLHDAVRERYNHKQEDPEKPTAQQQDPGAGPSTTGMETAGSGAPQQETGQNWTHSVSSNGVQRAAKRCCETHPNTSSSCGAPGNSRVGDSGLVGGHGEGLCAGKR